MEFLIFSVIVLIISFDVEKVREELTADMEIIDLKGIPRGFDYQWYYFYSFLLPIYLLVAVAIYNLYDILKCLVALFLRCKDRRF